MATDDPYRPPDDVNPYSAPEAELTPRLPGAAWEGAGFIEPFSIGAVLSRSWEIYKEKLGICILLVLGVGGICAVYNIAGNLLLSTIGDSPGKAVATVAFMLSMYALQFWLTLGQTLALIGVARGRDATFDEVFQGGRYFWRYVGACLLMGVAMIPVAFVIAAIVAAGIAVLANVQEPVVPVIVTLIGVALGVGLFLYVMARLYMFQYVLVDRDCGPIQALSGSIEITRGHVGELIVLILLIALIGVSGVLLCGVGLIFTIPLGMLMTAETYVMLAGPMAGVGSKDLRTDLEFLDS